MGVGCEKFFHVPPSLRVGERTKRERQTAQKTGI